MKRTIFLGMAAAVLVTAACTMMQAKGMRTTINKDINVVADGAKGCKYSGTVSPISVGHGNSATIVFHVKPTSDFKFTSNGIVFVDKPGIGSKPPQGEITPQNQSDTTWTFHDRNKTAGAFAYEVNVVRKVAGGVPCKLDPTILNDGTCTEGCD